MNTMQQEFDAVVEHLFKQGKPAKEASFCRYRTPDGLSCAVGCRIPDDLYEDEMETRNCEYLIQGECEGKYNLPSEISAYELMFNRLQIVHDGWMYVCEGDADHPVYPTSYLDEELPKVADEFGLTYNSPYKVE